MRIYTYFPHPSVHTTSLSLLLTLSLSLSPLSALSTFLPPPTRLPTHPTPTSRDGSDNADSVDEASAAQHAASAYPPPQQCSDVTQHHAHNNRLLCDE
ncbi:hypothetical protein C8J57DRAFT_1403563 [Mycena rebaudengoi]|nr:hypothetical protein C8J57DRAFT_1403563 [Mycena rebaudengoi]